MLMENLFKYHAKLEISAEAPVFYPEVKRILINCIFNKQRYVFIFQAEGEINKLDNQTYHEVVRLIKGHFKEEFYDKNRACVEEYAVSDIAEPTLSSEQEQCLHDEGSEALQE